ncbi:MAG: efflux RND transporter permease subunit [Desulfobacteraceae bacterium]|nr:MAG: efflux RND transporter permease subunit [Desulfobacteraceae bacterium]
MHLKKIITFCLERKFFVFLLVLLLTGWGILTAPFDWRIGGFLRDPVPVDAVPDIGENQQIVFCEWTGRSPQDIEDQITYPLSVSLLGIPKVKTIRTFSMFGFSTIYLIFEDGVDFYWSRTRILEKLNSLPSGTLPADVQPTLGPDATSLGQVFWYTLEGCDPQGRPTGGWDLHELRTIQDWYVRYALLSVPGVSEVASIGGFVQEYQVDLDPDLMRANKVSLNEVLAAVRGTNQDVGAQTIEVNRVEYLIRGLGFIKKLQDLETAVIKLNDNVPVFVGNVARVTLGPAPRRGALDKNGAESVGGVVVARFGENPYEVLAAVKRKIAEISPGLPRKQLAGGDSSQVRIVPFYDRSGLIRETLGTLETALTSEVLVTLLVVVVMLASLRSSLTVAGLLPLAVLTCFIGMKLFGVDANVVALSGIAIAIGTMVDMGIILTENIYRHLGDSKAAQIDRFNAVLTATREVSGAVLTATATTVVSFLPVFTMEAAEGKLFRPLAFTKTIALVASMTIAMVIIPPLSHLVLGRRSGTGKPGWILFEGLVYLGIGLSFLVDWRIGASMALIGVYHLIQRRLSLPLQKKLRLAGTAAIVAAVLITLAAHWLPLGPEKGLWRNILFAGTLMGGLLAFFYAFQKNYRRILSWCLAHKMFFLSFPLAGLLLGATVWQGYGKLFGWLPRLVHESALGEYAAARFPGLGREFMPPLNEGAFLFMPTNMPHASIAEMLEVIQIQDAAIQALPEVEYAVGKLGRAESPLDPAPVAMIETLINYRTEYLQGTNGQPLRFRHSMQENDYFRSPDGTPLAAADGKPYVVRGRFLRDEHKRLIPDAGGKPFRLWRPVLDPKLNRGRAPWPGIRKPDDIWNAVSRAAYLPGTTPAARLQPISARMVMLQSGIRSAMGIRVMGPDLQSINIASILIEEQLRHVRSISPGTVIADRLMGKPYLEIHIDRQAIAQYGVNLQQVLDVIEYSIGGKRVTTTVEARERYPVRVRYQRELRDTPETLGRVLVPAPDGTQIPLLQMARIEYTPGPEVIKGENTFLVGYILFDKIPGNADADAVEEAREHLLQAIDNGQLVLPDGVSYAFTGTYENQIRAEKRLALILPLALIIIFLILYLQFNSVSTSMMVFAGIIVAWAGGFIMIWLYAQPWFLNLDVFGVSMRDLFQVHPIHLSVAVWVGFLALFGIASDDGVVMATYLKTAFAENRVSSVAGIRQAVLEAGLRRVRPCLMTTATTLLALIPVLTATGRGADIMVPMAVPTFGGMLFETITMLVVPVVYCWREEARLRRGMETDR